MIYSVYIILFLSIVTAWYMSQDEFDNLQTLYGKFILYLISFLLFFCVYSTLFRGISYKVLLSCPVHTIETKIELRPFAKAEQLPNFDEYDWYILSKTKRSVNDPYEFKIATTEKTDSEMILYVNPNDCTIMIDENCTKPYLIKIDMVREYSSILASVLPLYDIVNETHYKVYIPNYKCIAFGGYIEPEKKK